MVDISMRQMLEAGVHFGHQTRYWHPKMAPYIFGERNKIHIINLETTLPLLKEAMSFLGKMAARNATILFVGTKRAAQEIVQQEASRCGMPYVNRRWLGGMLTNFKTVKQSLKRLKDLQQMEQDGSLERLSKKELLTFRRDLEKLSYVLSGIQDIEGLPDVLFIVDVGHEKIAIAEATKLGIPLVAVVDTNNSPDSIDYVIPGNDDAIRSIALYAKVAADTIIEGRQAIPQQLGDMVDEFVELDDAGRVVSEGMSDGADHEGLRKVVRKKAVAKKPVKKVPQGLEEGTPTPDPEVPITQAQVETTSEE
ncbi:MAG: 30S ribosomal protein S2 [Gammaproteobacteria bacterium]